MSHADRIAQAERAVIDAAVATREAGLRAVAEMTAAHNAGQDRTDAWKREMPLRDRLRRADDAAVDALLALRAQTCPECGGSGIGKPIEYRDASTQRLLHRSPNGCPACSGTGVKP